MVNKADIERKIISHHETITQLRDQQDDIDRSFAARIAELLGDISFLQEQKKELQDGK